MSKKRTYNTPPGFKVPENYFKDFKVVPPVTGISDRSGFEVPEAYFSDLTDRLLSESRKNTVKEPGFKVPDSYFENFEVPTPEKPVKVIPMFRKNLFKIASMAAAASLLYFVFTADFFRPDTKIDFDSLSANEIESWFIENPNSISNDELAEVLIGPEDEFISDISEDELSDYLLQTDLESLIDEN